MADLLDGVFSRLSEDAALAEDSRDAVFPVLVPQGTALPYIRMQVISDRRREHLKNYDARRQTIVRIDCMAKTYTQAKRMAERVIAIMNTPATAAGIEFGHSKAEGPRDLGEDTAAGYVHRQSVGLLVEHRLI